MAELHNNQPVIGVDILSGGGGGGGAVEVSNFPATQAVSGPLTDAQLRAAAVPVSGTVTATGPLTDAQLTAVTGAANAAAWDGAAASATVIAILKSIDAQLRIIATNTTPAP